MKLTHPQNLLKNRRQRRIQRRRAEIMDAAASIIAEQGYANTRTKAIAEAADMAEGTLYNYFKNKRDILMAILNQHQTEIDTLLDEVENIHGPIDAVSTVEWVFKLFLTRLNFLRVLLAESWTDDALMREHVTQRVTTIYQRVKSFVEAQMRAGTFRKVDPDLATQMVLGMCLAPVIPIIRGVIPPPSDIAIHTMAVNVVDLLLHGLEMD